MQVNQIVHQDDACGPKFTVTIRNCSTRNVCHFHVTAVAVLGRICPTSPNATVKVAQIGPGEALEVCLQLPIEALAMGNRHGQVIGFQRLVVADRQLDQLVETNEANNLKAFACSEIPVVTTVVEQTHGDHSDRPAGRGGDATGGSVERDRGTSGCCTRTAGRVTGPAG